jgi:hypothetical protein
VAMHASSARNSSRAAQELPNRASAARQVVLTTCPSERGHRIRRYAYLSWIEVSAREGYSPGSTLSHSWTVRQMTSSGSILEDRSSPSFRVTAGSSKGHGSASTRREVLSRGRCNWHGFAHSYRLPLIMLASGFSNENSEKSGVSASKIGDIRLTEGGGTESVNGAREGHAKYEKFGARPMCEMAGDMDCGVPDRDSCCSYCCCSQADGQSRPDSREGRAMRVDICESCTACSDNRDRKEGRRREVAPP